MELAKRDLTIQMLKDEIACRKKLLLKKVKELYSVENENEFLGEVVSDYSRYKEYIIKEKQQQYEALQIILNYINTLTKDINTAEQVLSESNYQQKMIYKELSTLKREIDDLIDK
jgi:predicted RND superfamily exporter protein